MNEQSAIAIVGGSLVGPALELLLRRCGFQNVTTFEATPQAHSQSGGVMGLRADTLAILADLGISLSSVKAIGDPNVYAYDMVNGEPVPRGTSYFPGMVTSWDLLYGSLQDMVAVQHNHRVVAMREEGGKYVLRFHRHEEAAFDLVFFADGRKSWGRDRLDPNRPLHYNGYVTWRGLIPPPSPLPKGFTRYYDEPNGRLFSITEPLLSSGRCYWELSHNISMGEYIDAVGCPPTGCAFVFPEQITPGVRGLIRQAAAFLPSDFFSLVECSEVAGIPVNDVAMPTRAVFRENGATAVLLGDALIPVRLQVGAGLNQGLIQAAEVARLLANGGSLDDWETNALNRLGPIVELGRSRAHRSNLGHYTPVRPGRTAAPMSDQWSEPRWVTA